MASIDTAVVLTAVMALIALPAFVAAAWTWWQVVHADQSPQLLESSGGPFAKT